MLGRWQESFDLVPAFCCVACHHEITLGGTVRKQIINGIITYRFYSPNPNKHEARCRAIPFWKQGIIKIGVNYADLPERIKRYPHGGFKPDNYKRY